MTLQREVEGEVVPLKPAKHRNFVDTSRALHLSVVTILQTDAQVPKIET